MRINDIKLRLPTLHTTEVSLIEKQLKKELDISNKRYTEEELSGLTDTLVELIKRHNVDKNESHDKICYSCKLEIEYIGNIQIKTTLMSVKMFKRNLLNVLQLCNGHAEVFGAGSGGGALKDIYQEGVAAIKEAEKYWESQNRILTKEIKDFMNVGVATDESTFAILLGKDWKTDNTLDPETKKLLGFL